jgi:mersacidin/lichenicidin family type 2 lantibiotic
MLIDEILQALRDPEYRAQLTSEVGAALPDRPIPSSEYAEPETEGADA